MNDIDSLMKKICFIGFLLAFCSCVYSEPQVTRCYEVGEILPQTTFQSLQDSF